MPREAWARTWQVVTSTSVPWSQMADPMPHVGREELQGYVAEPGSPSEWGLLPPSFCRWVCVCRESQASACSGRFISLLWKHRLHNQPGNCSFTTKLNYLIRSTSHTHLRLGASPPPPIGRRTMVWLEST